MKTHTSHYKQAKVLTLNTQFHTNTYYQYRAEQSPECKIMRASTILTIVLSTLAIAGPIRRTAGTDDVIVYPDEKLYNEEYKRAPGKIPKIRLSIHVAGRVLTLIE